MTHHVKITPIHYEEITKWKKTLKSDLMTVIIK